MKEIDAIHLSESHGLGSAQNTLVPGVVVPAYQKGTDPDRWIAGVKAIAQARLAPSSSGYSLYKPTADTVGSLPGYSGLANTTIQPKSPEEQAAVIAKLTEVLAAQGGDGGNPGADKFASGRWLFGNDFGGLQSASLASSAQDSANLNAARNFQLAQQQLAERAAEVQAANRRQQEVDAWLRSQQTEANRLAMLDRLTNAGQQAFQNKLDVARVTRQNADDSALTTAGIAALNSYGAAANEMSAAQRAYNARVYAAADQFNTAVGPDPMGMNGVLVQEDANGVAKIIPGRNVGSKANALYEGISKLPEYAALRAAQDKLTAAQIDQQKVQFTPRSPITPPELPQTNPASIQLLARYGFPITTAATNSPVARAPVALNAPGQAQVPRTSYVYSSGAGDLIGDPTISMPRYIYDPATNQLIPAH